MQFLRTLLFLFLLIPLVWGILSILGHFGYHIDDYIPPEIREKIIIPKLVNREEFLALKEDVKKIKKMFSSNQTMTSYLKFNSQLDIRGKNYVDVIAHGYKGDYARQLDCAKQSDNGECEWFKIAFNLKGGGSSIGFIQSSFVSKEHLDDVTYTQISQNSTIEYLWENQLAIQMKKAKINVLGIYIEGENQKRGVLQDHLLPRLIEQNVKPKFIKLEISDPATISTEIAQTCQKHQIEGLLYIKSNESRIRVYLYHYQGVILYVINVAFTDSASFFSKSLLQNSLELTNN